MVPSSDVWILSMGEEERTSLLFRLLLGASSVSVYSNVSYGSSLMKLRLNILLIERISHAVNSLLRQNMLILKDVKMCSLLMVTGMQCFAAIFSANWKMAAGNSENLKVWGNSNKARVLPLV